MANKFRQFTTSSGKLCLAGKDAETNEKLISEIIKDKKDYYVLHTAKPGSPFVVIKEEIKKITKQDIKEAAIFCAKYSREWKKAKIKKDIEVHYFLGKNIHKEKGMKTGTFGVRKFKEIKLKKKEIEG